MFTIIDIEDIDTGEDDFIPELSSLTDEDLEKFLEKEDPMMFLDESFDDDEWEDPLDNLYDDLDDWNDDLLFDEMED